MRRRLRQRVRASRAREVGEAQPEDDGATHAAGRAQPASEAVDEGDHDRVDVLVRSRPATERALSSDRAATPPDTHGARIPVVRKGVQLPARRTPEHRDEQRLVETGDLPDGADSTAVELLGGDAADSPQPLDRKWMQERELAVRRNERETVRLRDRARHLREELRPGDPDGDREPDLLEHPPTQPRRDLRRPAREPLETANVEERLVDRQPFDERRRVLEHLEHRLARLRVRGHPRRDHDRVRAQPPGTPAAHRRADAERLGLVARGEHDPAADDHRPAAQARIVPLLDRREERVEVGMEDRRLDVHEHMFA